MAEYDKIRELILASTNAGKVTELAYMLGKRVVVRGLDEFGDLPEVEEDGDTFAANARKKAVEYGLMLGGWVLADDSGLEIDALDGSPGVYSARFAGVDGNGRDAANNRKVLELLKDVPTEQRTARFRCCLCLSFNGKVVNEVDGKCQGQIAFEAAGTNGFGYDPLFYLPERKLTIAQLDKAKKNDVSHRGNALRNLWAAIENLL